MVVKLRHLGQKIFLIILITLAFLELVSRLVWWNHNFVDNLFAREMVLLPQPLVNKQQIEILENWAGDPERYLQHDPVLGWSLRPNAHVEQAGVSYTTNSIGIRSLREYSSEKPAGVIRIGAFGPSFTHGDEVSDEDTWPAQMERARPDLEVMNWGVGGYGTDQAFLRYQTQGAAYQPDIVIIGFEEDNVRRNVNRFRPFFRPQTGTPLTKPVFVDDDERGFILLANPFNSLEQLKTELLENPAHFLDLVCDGDFYCDRERYQPKPLDMFYSFRFLRTLRYRVEQTGRPKQPAIEDPYAQRVNFLLLQKFVATVVENGSRPIILIFPERASMEAHENGQATAYAAALTALRDRGLPVIDLAPAFAHAKTTDNADYGDYYASEGGHYNALGNYIVGQTVLAYLCQQKILENC